MRMRMEEQRMQALGMGLKRQGKPFAVCCMAASFNSYQVSGFMKRV